MQNKKAYIWGGISKIAPAAIQLLTNMLLARFLTPDDFGTIGVLNVIFLVANVLVEAGLGASLIKEKTILKQDCSTIAVFNLGVSSFLYISLYFFAPYIEAYFAISGLSTIVRWLSLTFIIGAIGLVPRALLIRELRFGILSIITIVSILLSSIVSIFMAYYGCGVYSLVGFQLINVLITSVMVIIISHYSFSVKFNVNSFKRLFSFGFFTTVISVIDTIYENLLTILTGKYLNISQAGYISQAKKLEEGMTSSIALTITNVNFPIMTKLKDDLPKFKDEAISLMKAIIKLIFPSLLFIILFSEHIIKILFGEEWLPASFYLSALMWAGMILILETLLKSYIKSLCAVKSLLNITFIKRIIGVIMILLILVINTEWLVYGYILSSFTGFIFNAYLYSRLIKSSIFSLLFDILKVIIPSLTCFIVLITIQSFVNNDLIIFIISILSIGAYYSILMLSFYREKISKKNRL